MALTRFRAGSPRFKTGEREREREALGLEADGCLFPLTTAAAGLCRLPATGDQQPGAGRHRAVLGVEVGGGSRGGPSKQHPPRWGPR